MSDIKLSVGQINITGYLRVNFREVANDTVVLPQSFVVPPVVPAVQNIIETGFNPVTHYIDFYESPDGVALGFLLATYVYDASTGTILSERRFYQGDGGGANDPIAPSYTITDPYLDGKNVVGVFKEGFRYLRPGSEYTAITDTITFIGATTPIQTSEVVSVDITYSQIGNTPTNQQFPKTIIEEAADFALGATHYEKLVEVNGATDVVTTTVADPLLIADNTKVAFNTDNGTQRYFAIQFTAGSYLLDDGVAKDIIWMARGEQLEMIKKGGYWRIIVWAGDHARVGEVVRADKQPRNTVPETGTWLLIVAYPRFFYEYVNQLDPGILTTGTYPTDPAETTKWCIDMVNGRFWVPDTQGYFERNTDFDGARDPDRPIGNRIPGSTQAGRVGQFTLTFDKGNDYLGGPNASRMGNGSANPQNFNYVVNSGQETRPNNINRNSYRKI